MFEKIKSIHFVGVGGIGMSGLALVLKNMGYQISGSDISKTSLTKYLESQGIKIYYTHAPQNIQNASVVVYSSAIKPDNPEIKYALSRKIPVIPRAEMLAELMRMKYSIAVSGTHGKTTTTSMIGTILEYAGYNPTVIVGGKFLGMKSGAKIGTGKYLVAEADESDRSFLLLYPTISVVTNIEKDHLDFYKNLSEIKKAFLLFVNKVPFYGASIICNDCKNVRSIIPHIKREFITYGIKYQADIQATNITYCDLRTNFTINYKGQSYEINLNVPGEHNVLNALAAIAVGLKLDIPFKTIKDALNNFTGIHRRLEKKGEKNNIIIFDDYAHHPTEIMATLKTLRLNYPNHKIIVIFQPHRYTRTLKLGLSFGSAFIYADLIIVTKIYPAQENPIPNVSSHIIVNAIKKFNQKHNKKIPVVYKKSFTEIIDFVKEIVKPNNIIITIGAGNIWQVGEELLKVL
ncbi:MAG: UDP-N-acetylmuramate--L-alanine ligase [candidate division WOR-3 bacterium]|nr:UDP-N-acetylmuramate--L-alanine ligase [candidate division WOR-3 bacterium]MCX7757349.1 UDP-N-acetylmuramate--L-alanine ligase [candidate division WOR-3 bacterium]MDW7988240.1 UDP-N-acetylmuramate--L-alanine ligase [candidate division WOR-3 bacterium]